MQGLIRTGLAGGSGAGMSPGLTSRRWLAANHSTCYTRVRPIRRSFMRRPVILALVASVSTVGLSVGYAGGISAAPLPMPTPKPSPKPSPTPAPAPSGTLSNGHVKTFDGVTAPPAPTPTPTAIAPR
jgi:hypothetical protein